MRRTAKVASSLADVWQQLFKQQYITVIPYALLTFTPGYMKPHQFTRAWKHRLKPTHRNTFIRNQWGTSVS